MTLTKRCDADTPDDPSDDHVTTLDSITTPDPINYVPIGLSPRSGCCQRHLRNGERVAFTTRVTTEVPEAGSCAREFEFSFVAVGGPNAGEPDPEQFSYAPLVDCAGGKLDPVTNLCWEEPTAFPTTVRQMYPGLDSLNWSDANAYCEGLAKGGHDDWRLPTVDELRSLFRPPYTYSPCVENRAGDSASCGPTVRDCDGITHCSAGCVVCARGCGFASRGCYWPTEFSGSCADYDYWFTSEEAEGVPGFRWSAGFVEAKFLAFDVRLASSYPRCVRMSEP